MGRTRILVVEDDTNTRDAVRDILLRAGYEVTTATTGRDALGVLLDADQPAVIILDLRMPVMDGREFLTVIRAYQRLASIPVLLLTAFDLEPRLAESVEAVVRKPFHPDELRATVDALVQHGMQRETHDER